METYGQTNNDQRLSIFRSGEPPGESSRPMDQREYRSLTAPIGAVLFVSGWVLSSEWIFAGAAALPQRHFAIVAWPLYLGLFLMGVGLYVFCAALIPRWRLPGKAAVRRRETQERTAIEYLGRFRAIYTMFVAEEAFWDSKYGDLMVWQSNAAEFVSAAFGSHWVPAVLAPKPRQGASGAAMYASADNGLARLVSSSNVVPVLVSFSWHDPAPDWKNYCDDWFRDVLPTIMERMQEQMPPEDQETQS